MKVREDSAPRCASPGRLICRWWDVLPRSRQLCRQVSDGRIRGGPCSVSQTQVDISVTSGYTTWVSQAHIIQWSKEIDSLRAKLPQEPLVGLLYKEIWKDSFKFNSLKKKNLSYKRQIFFSRLLFQSLSRTSMVIAQFADCLEWQRHFL